MTLLIYFDIKFHNFTVESKQNMIFILILKNFLMEQANNEFIFLIFEKKQRKGHIMPLHSAILPDFGRTSPSHIL